MPSTVIRSYEYIPEKEILLIIFISGSRYQYFDVNAATFDDFKNAFSKGTFLNKYMKPNHRYKKIKDLS